jgi:hypothetical protein
MNKLINISIYIGVTFILFSCGSDNGRFVSKKDTHGSVMITDTHTGNVKVFYLYSDGDLESFNYEEETYSVKPLNRIIKEQ